MGQGKLKALQAQYEHGQLQGVLEAERLMVS